MYLQLTSVVSSDPDSMCSRSTQVKTSPKCFFHYNINGELKNVTPSVFAFAVLEATSPCPVHPALPSFSTHPLLLLLHPSPPPPSPPWYYSTGELGKRECTVCSRCWRAKRRGEESEEKETAFFQRLVDATSEWGSAPAADQQLHQREPLSSSPALQGGGGTRSL